MSKRSSARHLAAAALALAFTAASVASSPAQDFAWDEGFAAHGFNGYLSAAVAWNGGVAAAGAFSANGLETMVNVAHWNGTAWTAMSVPNIVEATAIGVYDGELWLSGYHSSVPRPVQKWSGTAWVDAVPTLLGRANAMALYDGMLVLVGELEHDQIFHSTLVWDGSNMTWPGGPDGREILAMVELDGKLYCTGFFYEALGGIPMQSLGCWDGSTWSPVYGRSVPGGPLSEGLGSTTDYPYGFALAVHEGKLIVAGQFDLAGGLAVSNIARWDPVTQIWDAMAGGSPQRITELVVSDGQLLAAGGMSSIGGTAVQNLARWNGSAWESPGGGTNNTIACMAEVPGGLFLGGAFTEAGDLLAERAALLTAAGFVGLNNNGGLGPDGRVSALLQHEGLIVTAGTFTHAGSQRFGRIAGWDGSAWSQDFAGGADGSITALLAVPDGLVAAGAFSAIGGVAAANVAAWNGSAWQPFGAGLPGGAAALCLHDGALYAGGRLPSGAGFVTRWDGSTWNDLALQGSVLHVFDLASFAGELLVCADTWRFLADGIVTTPAARWNGSSWQPLLDGCGGTYTSRAFSLWPQNGALYLGGYDDDFDCSTTATLTGVWDGELLHRLAPYALDGSLYQKLVLTRAGIEKFGRQILGGQGSLDGGSLWSSRPGDSSWALMGEDLAGVVYALEHFGDALAVGGSFSRVGTPDSAGDAGLTASNFALLRSTLTAAEESPALAAASLAAWPNPFNPKIAIHYTLAAAGLHRLRVFDLQGREVARLREGESEAGALVVEWDAQDASSGIYLVQLETNGERLSRKLVLAK